MVVAETVLDDTVVNEFMVVAETVFDKEGNVEGESVDSKVSVESGVGVSDCKIVVELLKDIDDVYNGVSVVEPLDVPVVSNDAIDVMEPMEKSLNNGVIVDDANIDEVNISVVVLYEVKLLVIIEVTDSEFIIEAVCVIDDKIVVE